MTGNGPLLAALIAFLALIPKSRQLLRDPGNPALRATCGVLASLGVAEVVSWGPVYHAIGQLSGVPNLARYLMHLCALVAAAAVQSLFLHLSDPRTARKRTAHRWLLLAAIAVIMGGVFLVAGFDVEDPQNFADRYAGAPWMREYMVSFLAYLALAMIDIMRMSIRYSRQLPASALRTGLRVLTAGALVGLIYVVHKAGFILLVSLGGPKPWPEGPVSTVLILLGIVLVSAGLVIPSAAKAAVAVRQWPGQYRLYRAMHPLWRALYDLDSTANLTPPRRRPPLSTLGVETYRRVIEILDGLRRHDGYLDPAAGEEAARAAAAAGRSAAEARAAGDAASIAAMVDYIMRTPEASRRPPSPAAAPGFMDEPDIDASVRHLAAVSRLFPAALAQQKAHDHAH
ncbi:MAB_1171c family putative transporter [Actinoplanes sp. NPDC051861]|uniref:MAB_1171c family putative transporter n=1 Tax=Actinoplanes sp. NPDC051861 TaxID=3155170 RepID=UPI00342776FB